MNWQTVKDENVRHLWACPSKEESTNGCDEKEYVMPTFYERSGTPVCPRCDEDMIYVRTEINA
jgi:hypothetical protein